MKFEYVNFKNNNILKVIEKLVSQKFKLLIYWITIFYKSFYNNTAVSMITVTKC